MSKFRNGSRIVRNCWCVFLCTLALLFVSAPALAAPQPLTGTFVGKLVGREVAFSHKGKAHNDWAGVLQLKLDNGTDVAVFCIQIEVRVSSGDRYRSDGSVLDLPNGCQIRFLLDKYPASSAKDANEAAARQLAIWVFSDNVDPATIKDPAIRDRAIALVNEANAGPCPKRRTQAPDLVLEPPVANSAAGQTVAYAVRAGPEDAGQPVTASVSGPAVFADVNGASTGQQQQTLTLNDQGLANFWVSGTGAGQTNVQVELPYRLEAGTVFSQIDDSSPSQRLVLATGQDLVANASAQLNWAAGAPTPPPAPTAAPSPTAAPAAATPPPAPTKRPRKSESTPESTEQPTEQAAVQPTGTAVSGEATTATPVAVENAPAVPPANQPAAQPGAAAQAPAGQPASGAAPVQPRALPRTGDPAGSTGGLLVAVVLALLIGGWLVRRRAMR